VFILDSIIPLDSLNSYTEQPKSGDFLSLVSLCEYRVSMFLSKPAQCPSLCAPEVLELVSELSQAILPHLSHEQP
jgi:hypothetical protein